MKLALLALLVPFALAAALPTQTPARTPPGPDVYSGRSTEGSLQIALNDALNKAQVGVSKGGADMQFNWELAKVSGRRGGITGSNQVVVDVRVVR